MSGAEQPLMHAAHTRSWELLPWYLNSSLEGEELKQVQRHLGECLVCRRELGRLETLAEAVAAPISEHASTHAFLRLSAQINGARETASWPRRLLASLATVFAPIPLIAGAAVLIISSVLVATIVVSGNREVRRGEQPFQTLGQQQTRIFELSHPLVRVVLRDAPGDNTGLDAWLNRHAAELVDGPSEIGVMTVRVATGARPFATVLGEIRADEQTLFIEAVTLIGTRPDRHR